jgi:hypothetical protein
MRNLMLVAVAVAVAVAAIGGVCYAAGLVSISGAGSGAVGFFNLPLIF